MVKWTEDMIESELRRISDAIGHFPSVSEVRAMNMNGLACAVTKRGGFLAWSERLNIPRTHSDSDTGWDGEQAVADLFRARGYECVRSATVKAPHDLLINSILRIDVKSARYATYGNRVGHVTSGWFYRMGKLPQADALVFYQLDTGDFYAMPWWESPTTNVTISKGGGKYAKYLNAWWLVDEMIGRRAAERSKIGEAPAA